ncbi:unnamed protein product [Rhizophagus irregularis]|nr:unnamed protein product [Rhizophagus irregularis]
MTNLAGKYGERELFDAETVLEKEINLMDHEIKSIQKLNNYLLNIGMSTKDIKLLRELKDKRNEQFHSNRQTLTEALKRLNDPLPNNVDKYKAPLQRTLKTIGTWRGT